VRIADVCAFYAPEGGGVRTYVEQKLAAGPALGHEIVIVAPGERDETEHRGPGARIEWLAAPRFPLDRKYRYFDAGETIHRALDRISPDFVEASSPWRSATATGDWRGAAPRALIMHADPIAAFGYRWLGGLASVETIDRGLEPGWRYLRRAAAGFDLVVCANASLSERLGAQRIGRVVTCPMGIEEGLFSPVHRDEALRARMLERCALPADALLLLGVGRLAPEKRWPLVIEAAVAAGLDRPIGLVLVGDGRDRARILREINGNPHIHLAAPIGDRPALARLMASADALVHGCDAETFSMVAAEARASGLPLIVPDRGGAADHAKASDGFTYAAGSAADAARAIAAFAGRPRRRAKPAPVRTMEQHFRELFGRYETLVATRSRVA
jgi:alpha-1,6-mannosyltransferase